MSSAINANINILPRIPEGTPTRETLLAEAAALGDLYSEVTAHRGDLKADADEMLEGRADLADLTDRGYAISEEHFMRIEILRDELAPTAVEGVVKDATSEHLVKEANDARLRLLGIRGELARIGKAAGLPSALFSLNTTHTTRLNVVMMSMEEVLHHTLNHLDRLPDKARVRKLVTEARGVMDKQSRARRQAKLTRADRTLDTQTLDRLERLLLDVMMYVSAQGLAAYPNDPVREARYRLDHVYGRKPSVVGDVGAGGTTGNENAAGPDGELLPVPRAN